MAQSRILRMQLAASGQLIFTASLDIPMASIFPVLPGGDNYRAICYRVYIYATGQLGSKADSDIA